MAITSMKRSSILNTGKFRSASAITNKLVLLVDYLVIAGGGGGGDGGSPGGGGGGGAGGYRSNVPGQVSGGGSSAEPLFFVDLNVPYTVTVGAGGGPTGSGANSRFASIISTGGGAGFVHGGTVGDSPPWSGGSGGGAGGRGIVGQGSNGGSGGGSDGGGAGASSGSFGNRVGASSNITGTSVTRAQGGAANSGGVGPGGGGGGYHGGCCQVGFGGSAGAVIFAVPLGTAVSFSAGVTRSFLNVGSKTVYTVTATSTTSETVTFL